jgi:glutaredoxin
MYSRTTGCPYVSTAKRVLNTYNIEYRELFIDMDNTARERVLDWTGFLSVPTLVVALPGQDLPYAPHDPLPAGASPRGIDRGPMLTEASAGELEAWLKKHRFIES